MPPDIMSIDSDISKLLFFALTLPLDKIGALTPTPFTDNPGQHNNFMQDSFTLSGNGRQHQPMETHYGGY